MNWGVIFLAFVTSVFSSAVVSSIVTSLLENRSDFKKRKIAAYSDFLEQFVKMIRIEQWMTPLRDQELARLHNCVMQVRLLGNSKVADQADKVSSCIIEAGSAMHAEKFDE